MKQVEVLWKHPEWGFKQYTCDFVSKSADQITYVLLPTSLNGLQPLTCGKCIK